MFILVSVNSTCFENHYAHRQENRLYKKLRVVNAVFCIVWSPDDKHNDARNMLS